MGLSLIAQYHIRQLLHRDRQQLQVVAAPGRALSAHDQADLNAVVEGLYLDESKIEQVFRALEGYARLHLKVSRQERRAERLCSDLEGKIFALLGLRRLAVPSFEASALPKAV